MKEIKIIYEDDKIKRSINLLENSDVNEIDEILSYEEKIFGEGAIGMWNIKPFIKYGLVFVLIEYNKVNKKSILVSVSEIMNSFEESKSYLYGFFTFEKYTKKGYGNTLLSFIKEYLIIKYNINKIELTVDPNNINAVKLYQKLDFEIIELLKDEYGINENRYLMLSLQKSN